MAQKLIIEVIGDTKSYERALGRSAKATKQFQVGIKGMSGSVFKGLAAFTGVTVGVRALSNTLTSSVRASTDFQASLTKMIGLSGVASSAIGGLRKDVLQLAPQVGKGPQELADALFFITSSGIDAAHALDVLRVSAQASAAGLGETQVVADAVTSALNAYGQSNISAQQATDVLVATVREGKGEATEFAGVIGNVAAIAGELGVSFDQVGAALAAQTRLGTDAQTAATQLQQLFSALLNTSPKVAKAFDSVHLSLAETRKEIAQPGGFLPALRKIKDAFGTNIVALREAFPEIRAFRGVLALVGKQAAPVQGIFDRLAKSTGSLGTAFKAVSQTQAQQFARLSASIEVFRITLGSALAPAILDVVKPLNKWLSVSKNQETVQRKIRETVKTVVGVIRTLVGDLKTLFGVAKNATDALGGMRNVMQILIPLFVAGKIVSFAGAITGLSTQMLVAEGRAKALRTALLRLGAIGVIAIAIELFIHRHEIEEKAKEINRIISDKLGGIFGGDLPVNIPLKVKNLPELIRAREELARLNGEDDVRVEVLDRIIARLKEIAGLTKTREPGSGRHGRGRAEAIARGRAPDTPTVRTGGGGESDELTAKELAAIRKKAAAAATKAFEKALALLDIQAAQATRTKSLRDDLAIQRQIERTIKARLAVTKDDVALQQQLVEAQNQILDTQKQITDNQKAAKQAKIFKALGLTAEGDKPTPSSGALIHRAKGMLESIKGTVLDTKKNRQQLKQIIAVLKRNFKGATKEVRAAILEMLNDIDNVSTTKTGPLTKTHGLNTRKLAEGLGLTPEQERELSQRASKFNTAGRALGGNRTNAPGAGRRVDPRGGGPIVVDSHITVNLDGQRIANVVTRNQQKSRRRNPKQKRGQNRGD